jgi:ubiquinone/menaquinone biosynthesis C-methylase UbiE
MSRCEVVVDGIVVTHEEAVALLAPAGPWRGAWADVGAGTGTFTHAMAELIGPDGVVYAIDRDARALEELQRTSERTSSAAARISALHGDMHELSEIVELRDLRLDGVLFANALHFTRKADAVLAQAAERLTSDGHIVVIEYDRRMPNPWVPHPLTLDRLHDVAQRAGLCAPVEVARRPSVYHREMYCAVLAH